MMLNIIGNIFNTSGYSSHIKQLAQALHELGQEVRIESPKPQGWESLVNDAQLLMLSREQKNDMITILIGQPPFIPFHWSDNPKAIIPFVIWEGNLCPKYWIKYLLDNKIKMIFVPSQHVKDAILNTSYEAKILESKIKIIPHGVDLSLFMRKEKKERENFVFLSNKGWAQGNNDRGGVQFLIKAYAEEFTKDEPVELRIKINPAYCPVGWNVQEEIKKIGVEKRENSPKLLISTDAVDYKKMPEFYDGDVFISSTMGDAFNIPCLEAMSLGIPVITTDFGGQTDFVNEQNGWLIGGEMVEVTWDKAYEGVSWKKPDVEALKRKMRYCYENREEVKRKSEQAFLDAQKYSWRSAAEKLIENLKNLESS